MHDDLSERSLISSIASHERWARIPAREDRVAATETMRRIGREKLVEQFRREVDPDGVMTRAERDAVVKNLISAYYQRLSLRAVQARRKKAEAAREAELLAAAERLGQPEDVA